MAYTPTEWSNGDVITAEKLNKIEGGVASGIKRVTVLRSGGDTDSPTFSIEDSSFNEIKSFFDAGGFVYVALTDGVGADAESDYRDYQIHILEDTGAHTFTFRSTHGLLFIYDGDYVSYRSSSLN